MSFNGVDNLDAYKRLLTCLDEIRADYPWFQVTVEVLCGFDADTPEPMGVTIMFQPLEDPPQHLVRIDT